MVTASIGGIDIAQTQAVVPVSWEISCNVKLKHREHGALFSSTLRAKTPDRISGKEDSALEAQKAFIAKFRASPVFEMLRVFANPSP